MSSSGKAGSGRGNRKRPFRRRDNNSWQEGDSGGRSGGEPRSSRAQQPAKGSGAQFKRGNENARGDKFSYFERPKWIPPNINPDPLPVSDCPWCGKPIRDMSSAIADKDTGYPVHFDCVTSRIAFGEKLERGDTVAYIGGGRFAVVCFGSGGSSPRSSSGVLPGVLPVDSQDKSGSMQMSGRNSSSAGRGFTIKKIIEWENKDRRAEWRSVICDHYSVT